MPQLSLYVTHEQFIKIETEAHAQKMSLSKWVVSKIMEKSESRYPDGWENLFDSDSSFYRPEQPEEEIRESLFYNVFY